MVAELKYCEADLHCHTTASDGLLTPAELVERAAEKGLKGIAVTDHDTIQGWQEAVTAGINFQIRILRGIELSTEYKGQEVHILGYELDGSSAYLHNKLRSMRDARKQRMLEIIARLAELNIQISFADVRKRAQGESVGRPHIAQILRERGYVSSIKEAFAQYIGIGAPAYVPRYKLSPEEGIAIIRRAKGVAVLAHPGLHGLDEGIPDWFKAGLQGIEVYHSEHSQEDEKKYLAIAQKYNLLITGGSDFHGELHKPGVELGRWGVSLDVLESIANLAHSYQRG